MSISLEELKWLAVDLDGTLANSTGYPDYTLTTPIVENIEKLKACTDKGYKVIIHTARHWEEYATIEEWLNNNGVPFKFIQCGKILAHRYIDDRAIRADSDWATQL